MAPLDESAHEALMHLHAFSGDRPSALRVYHDFASELKRELGIKPRAAWHCRLLSCGKCDTTQTMGVRSSH